MPEKFSLFQNYPNPFNPVTTIKFDIPQGDIVKLKLYDVLGKEVSTIYNGRLEAGTYKIDFNAADISSGVYFYKIESGVYSDVKKMVILK